MLVYQLSLIFRFITLNLYIVLTADGQFIPQSSPRDCDRGIDDLTWASSYPGRRKCWPDTICWVQFNFIYFMLKISCSLFQVPWKPFYSLRVALQCILGRARGRERRASVWPERGSCLNVWSPQNITISLHIGRETIYGLKKNCMSLKWFPGICRNQG